MEKMTLEKTVAIFLEEKKYKTLRDIITVMQPFDIAQMVDEMSNDKRIVLFRLLPKELAAETFGLHPRPAGASPHTPPETGVHL